MNNVAQRSEGRREDSALYWRIAGVGILLILIAHYLRIRSYGFYEDDWAHIAGSLEWTGAQAWGQVKSAFRYWPQGRPLNFTLPYLAGYVAGKCPNPLLALHVGGLVVLSINFGLLLRILWSEGRFLAFLAASILVLWPADTSQITLTSAFHVQTSMSFLLAGILATKTGRPLLGHALAGLSLLAYEPAYPLFAAVPVLLHRRNSGRRLAPSIVSHTLGMSAIVGLVLTVRLLLGESRAAEAANNLGSVFYRIVVAIVVGPVRSMAEMLRGPLESVRFWGGLEVAAGLISAFLVFAVVRRLEKADKAWAVLRRQTDCSGRSDDRTWALNQTALAGLLMLPLAYVLSFTHFPPSARNGRLTAVHFAAALPGALLMGVAGRRVFLSASLPLARRVVCAVLSASIGALVAHRVAIGKSYSEAWFIQKAFWKDVIRLCPDLDDGVLVFVDPGGLPHAKYIQTNSWADPIILGLSLKASPGAWKVPPRLFPMRLQDVDARETAGKSCVWAIPSAFSDWPAARVDRSGVIELAAEPDGGSLKRRSGLTRLGRCSLVGRDVAEGRSAFTLRLVGQILLDRGRVSGETESGPVGRPTR